LISPAASYSPTAPIPGESGEDETEAETDPNAPKPSRITALALGTNPIIDLNLVNTAGAVLSDISIRLYLDDMIDRVSIYGAVFDFTNARVGKNLWDCEWTSPGKSSKSSNYIEVSPVKSSTVLSESFSLTMVWSLGAPWYEEYKLKSMLFEIDDRVEVYYNGQLISARSKYH